MPPLIALDILASCQDIPTYVPVEAKTFPLHYSNRRVSFSLTAQRRDVLHICDYAAEERKACWYSPTELQNIKLAAKQIVIEMIQGKVEDDQWCSRGLEARTRKGRREKIESRFHARSAVLMEQNDQVISGLYDPEKMADIYHECTEYHQTVAEMIGAHDAREAALTKISEVQRTHFQEQQDIFMVVENTNASTISLPKNLFLHLEK
jgi:hypothetical protein